MASRSIPCSTPEKVTNNIFLVNGGKVVWNCFTGRAAKSTANCFRRNALENNKVTPNYRMERIDNIADHILR